NVTRWEFVEQAAQVSGLDTDKLKSDYEGAAQIHFQADLNFAQSLGVRGFPTLFFINEGGTQEKVYGTKPYSVFENVIHKLHPEAKAQPYDRSPESLFQLYPSLASREFSELAQHPIQETKVLLERLYQEGSLLKISSKNGDIFQWA
ncbi:MAG: DsbA family protein, partial [Bacteroidota bacterium]